MVAKNKGYTQEACNLLLLRTLRVALLPTGKYTQVGKTAIGRLAFSLGGCPASSLFICGLVTKSLEFDLVKA